MSFALGAVVAAEFGCGAGAGLRVGWPGGGGEHERQVGVGAAGHRRVQPLAVFAAGDQRYRGVHGCALGGVPGDRVRQVTGAVAGVGEGLGGEPPLPGLRVGVEHAADHDAVAGDGLDPQDVAVGQGAAGLARFDGVVVVAADDQVAGAGGGAFGDLHGAGGVDQAEVDEVVADPGGQFPAAGPVGGGEDHVAAGQVAGHVGPGGLVHGLLGRGAVDAAVLVVVVQRGRVALAQPQRGVPFPGLGEPHGLGQLHVSQPVSEQHHRAAALDRGELLLVAGEDHLAAVPGRVADDGRQVGHGDHRALVHHDERARGDAAVVDVGQQPGGVRRHLYAGLAQLVRGVLGGGGPEHASRPAWLGPGLRGGRERAGLAGARGPDDHLHGPAGGEHVVDGGGLVEAQPALRDVLARVVRAFAQLCLEQRGVCAEPLCRSARAAGAARLASGLARPAAPRRTAARRWRSVRCLAACRRCGRPVRGAASQAAAAIPGPRARRRARCPPTVPHRPGRAAASARRRAASAGSARASPARAA